MVLSFLLQGPSVVRSAGPITEYPIPAASIGRPTEITTGADGNLWFLESTSAEEEFAYGQIQRMTIRDSISFASIPIPGTRVSGIAFGKLGEILFAQPNHNKVGRLFPTFNQTLPQIEEIDLVPGSGQPRGVASLDDAIWFTAFSTGQIGRISLNTERTVRYFDLKTPNSYPSAIAVGPDGKSLYFIIEVATGVTSGAPTQESVVYKIGRVALDGSIAEFPIPDVRSRPNALTAGPDGNIWFTDPALNSIWRLTPEGAFVSFKVRTEDSEPSGITTGPDGKLYFTEFKASKIGVITADGVITAEIPTPTQNSGPSGVTVGSDGNIWFTEANAARVGRLELAADLGLAVAASPAFAGRGQDVTLTIAIANQGPDSAANASVSLGKLLPYYNIVSCEAGAGGICLPLPDDEVPDYLIRIPFLPSGGNVTATVVARITNCFASSGGFPSISTAISISSQAPDQTSENNTSVVTVNTSPPAKFTVLDGGDEIRLGPVRPGVAPDPNSPAAVFRLENTGCVPLRLTVDSLRRIPLITGNQGSSRLCMQPQLGVGDDFKFFEIREIGPVGGSAARREVDQLGQPLRSGMRLSEIPPGESLDLRVQFKAQLPGFAGDNLLSTDFALPDQISALLTLSQPQFNAGSAVAATRIPTQIPIGPPTTVAIKGFISPVVQIVPRDPADGSLAQITRSGDRFEVRFSAFDAKLNVRRATYQFFDQYRAPVAAPIAVSLEDAICQRGIVDGQSFTVIARFAGAAGYPEIKHVQATVFDDEGSAAADSFPNDSFGNAGPASARSAVKRTEVRSTFSFSLPIVHLPPRKTKEQ